MDQVEVDLLGVQRFDRFLKGGEGFTPSLRLNLKLGRDEDLGAGDAGGGDPGGDAALVAVGGGGVNVAIARREGGLPGAVGLVRRYLENAEPDLRDLRSVVEPDVRNVGHGVRNWRGRSRSAGRRA